MRLTKKDIQHGYEAIKKKAKRSFRDGEYTSARRYLEVCSRTACQFNLRYADDDLECLLKQIAERTIKQVSEYEPLADHWILYDDFCSTYVLGLQWLEAMAFSGRQILYITPRNIKADSRHKNILDRVAEYPNVVVEIIPQGDDFERAQILYDTIVRHRASKLVLHKRPASFVIDIVLPVLPMGVTRYIINLSDQTFWIGARSVDYCLEFRSFGASVSLQRRGLHLSQLLMVPFYPADDQNPFAGFPPECSEGKIIIFSGGDFYKTLDDKRIYWLLIQRILNNYPQVVFLFATKNNLDGDTEINRFIEENHFGGRFIYINFRPDIYQVFAHCDIYMGTSPVSGSLMSQLAAINGKPILQYYEPDTPDDETEQAICINDHFAISFQDENCFLKEADRLITDQEYRHKQGVRLQKAMIQREQFNSLVLKTLESNRTQLPINDYEINYRMLDDRWYYLERAGYLQTMSYLYGTLGGRDCLRYAPGIFVKKNLKKLVGKRRISR